jgi:GTP-binding protein LepA
MYDPKFIRNFCIIAHVDHGKSTLADRLIEATGTLTKREMKEQILDSMDIERERGITIKAQTCTMQYKADDGLVYQLNLIDTPGHVDFSYEVSRSLAACEGALVVVDASQGVEAQTVANVQLAMRNSLALIPVINKIDLPSAQPDEVAEQIENELMIDATEAMPVSAKTGVGIRPLLEAIVKRVPPPKDRREEPFSALIFDSWFDSYLGAVSLCKVVSGEVRRNGRMMMMSTGKAFEVLKLGKLTPRPVDIEEASAGEVCFMAGAVKTVSDTRVGDTVTDPKRPVAKPIDGFEPAKQMVFGGIFPVDTQDYIPLKEALEKLQLNDSSLVFEVESSSALGFGFRVGFLGLLHMDVIQERLEREYKLNLLFTAPTVVYRVVLTTGETQDIENPARMPDVTHIEQFLEPYVNVTVHTPEECIGNVLKLLQERRGIQRSMDYVGRSRMRLAYEMPMAEMIFDFHDKLKSLSKGYASMDYEFLEYRQGDMVKMDILVNNDPVDALTCIVHRDQAVRKGRGICSKLRELLPRQQFQVPIQAALGGKIIARETLAAYRKDVTAKCYGGDITRKRKLLERQKEGKKRMKQVGSVEIPQEAFLAIFKLDEE